VENKAILKANHYNRMQAFQWIYEHPTTAVGILCQMLENDQLDERTIGELQQLHLRLGSFMQRSLRGY